MGLPPDTGERVPEITYSYCGRMKDCIDQGDWLYTQTVQLTTDSRPSKNNH